MATPDYTVDALLTGAKVRANHPDTGGRPTDSEILRMANGALLGVMTGRLMAAVQAELGAEIVVPIVKGTAKYSLPQRAAGPKLRYLCLSDSGNNRYPITITSAERWMYQNPSLGMGDPSYGAYLEGNNIVLTPTPTTSSYNLVIGYYQRPNQMVAFSPASGNATCFSVTAAAAAGVTTISVDNGGAVLGAGTYDIVSGTPHFGLSNIDLAVTAVGTFSATLASGLPTAISAGDYLCPANTTCVVPLPVEIQPLLEVRTAMAILRAKNDQSGLKNALMEEAAEMEDQLYTYFSNRVEAAVDTLGANSLMDFDGTSGYSTRGGLF